jgi:hypothetical protein
MHINRQIDRFVNSSIIRPKDASAYTVRELLIKVKS